MRKKIINTIFGVGLLSLSFILFSCSNGNNDNTTTIPTTLTPVTTTSTTPTTSSRVVTTTTIDGYKVVFDSDGGSNVDTEIVEKNGKVVKPSDPIRGDNVFLGWYNGDTLFDFNTLISSDITLKAKWYGAQFNIGGIADNSVNYITATFKDDYIIDGANVFNKNLAKFLFGCATIYGKDEAINKLLLDNSFDGIINYPNNDNPYEGICFTFANKTTSNGKVIIAVVRGMDYGDEWCDNFNVGDTGDHAGFSRAASVVEDALIKYVDDNKSEEDVKIMICGYSRAGAVSNILASKLLSKDIKITQDNNLYTYTFEAPKGLLKENAIRYDNVFNIIIDGDFITNILPDAYGFARCGIDINIYNDELSSLIKEYNTKLKLPEFSSVEGLFSTRGEFAEYVINILISYNEKEELKMSSRSELMNNYSDLFSFLFDKLMFGIKPQTKAKLSASIQSLIDVSPVNVISMLGDGKVLHDFLKPFLDEDGISYTDIELTSACEKLTGFIAGPANPIVFMLVMPTARNDMIGMFMMHAPIIPYILLTSYKHVE